MKKITRIFSAALAVASMAACTQGFDESNENVTLGGNEFAAEAEASTKVTIDANWKLSWEAGDQVDIFDGESTNVFSAKTAGASTTLAADDKDFTKESGKTYYAVYPSGANEFAGSEVTLTVAGDRKAEAGVYPSAPAVGVTTGSESSFAFKNVCGLVSFEIAADQNITSVVVFGANNEYVAGSVKVNAETAEYQLVEGTGVKEILLTPAEGDVFAAGRYYVAVLPQEFTAGLSMTLYKNDGTRLRKNLKAFTLGRSTHIDVETGGTFKTEFTIKNADELAAFMAVADKCAEGTVATLANNIDLAGVTLPAVSSFAGTFDGKGMSLMNWTTDKPLFTKIEARATVTGIVLDESCTLKLIETDARHQAFIVAENQGEVSYCTNNADVNYTRAADVPMQKRLFGTIVGYSTGVVSYCHNNGDISIVIPNLDYTPADDQQYQHQRLGGVVGGFSVSAGEVGVTDCTNSGDITYDFQGVFDSTDDVGKTLRPMMVLGGICGIAGKDGIATIATSAVDNGIIENCTNTGSVTLKVSDIDGGNYANVGGVVGYVEGTVNNCVNGKSGESLGAVKLTGGAEDTAKLSSPSVGGVAGTILVGTIKNSSNYASVELEGYVQSANSIAQFCGGNVAPAIGGVAGKVGTSTSAHDNTIVDCANSGAVTLNSRGAATATVNTGGVIGWTNVMLKGSGSKKLYNQGKVLVKNAFATANIGGVVGQSASKYSTVYNDGEVKVELNSTTQIKEMRIGGVAGHMSGSDLPKDPIKDATEPDNTTKSKSPVNLVTGQNNGEINISGGVNTSNIAYVGGVVGLSEISNMSHQETSWDKCNSNTGNISVSSPVRVIAGGVYGREKGTGMTITAHVGGRTVSGAKNRGNIEVSNLSANSRIGGIIGQHGQGVLGNANNFGRYSSSPSSSASNDFASIIVTGADNTTCVGGYVGYIETTNGGNQNCSMALSGCGIYGEINASGATVGMIVGRLKFAGNSVTNGTMLGTNSSERPKLHEDCKLNGSEIGRLDETGNTIGLKQNTYFGEIIANANSTKKVKDTPFFCSGWNKTILNSFASGLQNY